MWTEEISNALSETLRNDRLQNLTTDISEVILDSFINEGMLKDIPVINTLLNVIKGFSTVKDQLFLKKLISFLSKSKEISPEERKIMIDEINNSKQFRMKVGEKLLYLIERSDDWEISEILSVFFNEFIKKEISYEDFIKISKIIEKLTVHDLKAFQKLVLEKASDFFQRKYFDSTEVGDLINSWLFTYYISEISIDDEDDWEMMRKYKTSGGELIVEISNLGTKINKTLKHLYS